MTHETIPPEEEQITTKKERKRRLKKAEIAKLMEPYNEIIERMKDVPQLPFVSIKELEKSQRSIYIRPNPQSKD